MDVEFQERQPVTFIYLISHCGESSLSVSVSHASTAPL